VLMILISPEAGSTLPGATARHCLSASLSAAPAGAPCCLSAVSVSENTASMATFMAIEHNSPRRVDVRITLARLLLLFFSSLPSAKCCIIMSPDICAMDRAR